MTRTTKILIALGVIALGAFVVFNKKGKGSQTEKVTIEKATKRTITETVSTSGKVFPETEIRVSPDFSGQVTELRVSEGDTVKKGQVLVIISSRSIQAPINGVVLSLKVKKGESVTGNTFSVGTEIMTVADMSLLEVKADVGETDILKVSIGDSADVMVDAYNNKKFRGVVSRIANSTKTSTQGMAIGNDITNYEVKIRIDSNSYKELSGRAFPFRPGMNASVEIKTKKVENVISVPIAAVGSRVKGSDKSLDEKRKETEKNEDEIEDPNANPTDLDEVVFVLQKDGTVRKTIVKTGVQDITHIEVLQGLKEGEEVVTGPYSAISKILKNGMKVKVVAKEKLFEN